MANREWPYVLELEGQTGALVYYGSWHTNNPDDPQIADMAARWNSFEPTVALTENRGGFVPGGKRRAVKMLGEFGQLIEMGKRDNLTILSLETTWEDEIAMVTSRFSPAEATLFYTLRVYLSERGDETDLTRQNKLAAHLLKKRGSRPGLEGSLNSLDELDALWKASFDSDTDWRSLPPEAIWPGDKPTRLQAISRFVNEIRDRHMAAVILDFLRKGERVFAVAGGSHVVKQEPVLRAGMQSE